MANEKFLTGHSNEALEALLRRRESIIMSLSNGTRDDELYSKAVDVLSKAELFLYALLVNDELLFNTIYDTAVNEAHKRQSVYDERKLLAAKSFGHWGWFSSDRQAWEHSLLTGYTDAANCPAKLLCYFGTYQILCGKLEQGISSLRSSVDALSSSSDETVLKLLVYQVLAVAHWRRQEHKTASYFVDLFKSEGKDGSAWVGGLTSSNDIWPSMTDDVLFYITNKLIYLS